MLLIEGLLGPAKLAELTDMIATAPYVDGRGSGGTAGSLLKNNLELDKRHPAYVGANSLVVEAMLGCEIFQSYALPHVMTPVMFSKYGPGMKYGEHVDAALQNIPGRYLRTDLSFTLFLAAPESYAGGELVVKSRGGEQSVKGKAGDMVVYHTGVVHRVNPVSDGWRHVAIGWVQSMVGDHSRRELLYDLLLAQNGLLATHGLTREFQLVNSTYVNLLRMFSQP